MAIKLASLFELEYPLPKNEKEYHSSVYGDFNWKGKLIWMSPEKFLRLANPLLMSIRREDSIQNLEARMRAGQPVDPLTLYVDMENRSVTGHEGRHRATVAKRLGIEKVPVFIYTGSNFKRVPQWSPEDHAKVDKAEFYPEWAEKLHSVVSSIRIVKNKIEELENDLQNELEENPDQKQEIIDYYTPIINNTKEELAKLEQKRIDWEKFYPIGQ